MDRNSWVWEEDTLNCFVTASYSWRHLTGHRPCDSSNGAIMTDDVIFPGLDGEYNPFCGVGTSNQ